MPDAPPASLSPPTPWWRGLDRQHWFVFAMASLAWMFDCLDQQLFILARNPAIADLMPKDTPADVQRWWGGTTTAVFVAGWAVGGLVFGAMGDRIGRARTLTITVLLYSLFTGLCALAQGVVDFCAYRFITGLGVGGVFGLAVALVADTLPDRSRPAALGVLQSMSTVGNVIAGAIAIGIGAWQVSEVRAGGAPRADTWKWLFLVGALPALLCVFLQLRLREPESWVRARAAGKLSGVRFGSYRSLFGEARWRRPALLGMLLCVAGVVGLWGVGFFSPELVAGVVNRRLQDTATPTAELAGARMQWTGINMVAQNLGGFAGMLTFTRLSLIYGRKPVFLWGIVAALASTLLVFQCFDSIWHMFVLIPLMGFCQLGLFAGFAMYLPELFPLRLRSTGTSFCYNVGRFIAASGPFTLGALQAHLAAGAATSEAKLDAFRDAACWMSLVYVLGLFALPLLPETRGQPMPEE